jgi:hypothetical protein
MAPFDARYNPSAVMLGAGSGNYLPTTKPGGPSKPNPTTNPGAPAAPLSYGPQSVRATGSGPFDAAYRQNLATYAGGLFSRPGGNLSFNPTNAAAFPGQPTGGGTAPVLGMPNTLLAQALSRGQNPPPNTPSGAGDLSQQGTNQWWLDQFLGQGNLFGQTVNNNG